MNDLDRLRAAIRGDTLAADAAILDRLTAAQGPDAAARARAGTRAAEMVSAIRQAARPGLMEVFLAEYGLSTEEGVALMCLAEALLRVPDPETIDALIEDKIAPSAWSDHLGRSSSPLVNASTWALMITGSLLQDGDGPAAALRSALRRLGEPVIRAAVARAIRELGHQFVLGRTIEEAVQRGRAQADRGYTFSYDMLGEAAMTAADAARYFDAYAGAIARLAGRCQAGDVRENPGISVKLSALHPRYETAQKARVMAELVPAVTALARQAAGAGMGFNIDAEEADRLDLSLDVVEAVVADPALAGWDGFGVVVQGYGKRAGGVIDWLDALARARDRRLMVRLVKGAYWDTEVKRAQVAGLGGYPVFIRKAATDAAYICAARQLLAHTPRLYPQFATHNAHTVASILECGADPRSFEFQRLHGMGEALHNQVLAAEGTRCRIYAPVGAHRDLLAYLVRRLLENGANSSFVNQIVDTSVPPAVVAADPFDRLDDGGPAPVPLPADIFQPERANSRGWDLADPAVLDGLSSARDIWTDHRWQAAPILAVESTGGGGAKIANPADPGDSVGFVRWATPADVGDAAKAAVPWAAPLGERAEILTRAAALYEEHHAEVFALLAREAGKTLADAVAELREAVDFLRYYAARAADAPPRGVFACISPWNFPLAIFTGQIAAALAAGNAVLAKPAEATSLIAARATELLHQAGVPRTALQLLPGEGHSIGAALTAAPGVGGVCFTGSTATAQAIHRTMAEHLTPDATLIAETGGLNAMVVDSTALAEQAVRDILTSAFQSAGQRCSALRILYVQEDIADSLTAMLIGAMDELALGNPWDIATDVGPVIDDRARAEIAAYVAQAEAEGRLIHKRAAPTTGTFVGPTLLRVRGIEALEREVFGPVLHLAKFRAADLDRVVDAVNAAGYGLTFGLHSRIDDRVAEVTARLKVGNIYVNRNQIGAVVGSQPFGGEGLSGTGPKAGGPAYLPQFQAQGRVSHTAVPGPILAAEAVAKALAALPRPADDATDGENLPGPTGESNRLSTLARGIVLCLGPTAADAAEQVALAQAAGCAALAAAPGGPSLDGILPREALTTVGPIDAVALWSDDDDLRAARRALAARTGPIIPLLSGRDMAARCRIERHICIDTTAAGGNASLLAASA